MGDPTCRKTVYTTSRDVVGYTCRKPATVERQGVWYCNLHDPERPDKIARQAKAQARWDADMRRRGADAEGGALLRDLAPADPAAGAAALRALATVSKSAATMLVDYVAALGECDHAVNICNFTEQCILGELERALAQLEAAHHGTR